VIVGGALLANLSEGPTAVCILRLYSRCVNVGAPLSGGCYKVGEMREGLLQAIGASLRPIEVSPEQLALDPKNPRLSGKPSPNGCVDVLDPRLQETLRRTMIERFDGQQLVESMERVGFLSVDRLVVRSVQSGTYLVIEGNRRLAAIRTVLGREQRRLITLSDEVRESLQRLEVLQLECAESAGDEATWLLQGARHVSGVKAWGPYQQAALLSQLVERFGVNFSDAGKAVGVGPRRAGHMLRAYRGLLQMSEDGEFSEYAKPDVYSHFEQAWIKKEVRAWLEWDDKVGVYKNRENLHHFYRWISVGIPEAGQVPLRAAEVRDKLALLVSCEDALKLFCLGRLDLDEAVAMCPASPRNPAQFDKAVNRVLRDLRRVREDSILPPENLDSLRELRDTLDALLATST